MTADSSSPATETLTSDMQAPTGNTNSEISNLFRRAVWYFRVFVVAVVSVGALFVLSEAVRF